jgi:D-psicose/D-tagatose/L-ribulose 3-epimerase
MLWVERFDSKPESVIRKVKQLGFDGIEIFVTPEQIKTFDRKRVNEALKDESIACLGSTVLDLRTDLTSSDERTRRNGINYLRNAAQTFSEFGANLLAGVVYDAWGKIMGRGRTEEEWNHSASSLKEVCRLIKPYNIMLG